MKTWRKLAKNIWLPCKWCLCCAKLHTLLFAKVTLYKEVFYCSKISPYKLYSWCYFCISSTFPFRHFSTSTPLHKKTIFMHVHLCIAYLLHKVHTWSDTQQFKLCILVKNIIKFFCFLIFWVLVRAYSTTYTGEYTLLVC